MDLLSSAPRAWSRDFWSRGPKIPAVDKAVRLLGSSFTADFSMMDRRQWISSAKIHKSSHELYNYSASPKFRGLQPTQDTLRRSGPEKWDARKARELEHLGPWSEAGKALHAKVISGTADPVECLQYRALHLLVKTYMSLPRAQRPKAFRNEGVGLAQEALRIMWADETIWKPIMLYGSETHVPLCYLAAAEGLTNLVTKWLTVDRIPSTPIKLDVTWRNSLFRGIVSAHLVHDTLSDASPALREFFDIVNMLTEYKRPGKLRLDDSRHELAGISLYPACLVLLTELTLRKYYRTDVNLYDSFVRFCHCAPKVRRPAANGDFFLSALDLYHPKTPNADAALRFLRMFTEMSTSQAEQSSSEIITTLPVMEKFLDRARKLRPEESSLINEAGAVLLRNRREPRNRLKQREKMYQSPSAFTSSLLSPSLASINGDEVGK